jgi:hypothetical protein
MIVGAEAKLELASPQALIEPAKFFDRWDSDNKASKKHRDSNDSDVAKVVVCMAELFSVSSASLPGRTAIAMARQNWQNRIG